MSSNIKIYEIEGTIYFYNPLTPGSDLILHKIIMDIKEQVGELFSVTIKN